MGFLPILLPFLEAVTGKRINPGGPKRPFQKTDEFGGQRPKKKTDKCAPKPDFPGRPPCRTPDISPKCPILMRRIRRSKSGNVRSQCAGFGHNDEGRPIQSATTGTAPYRGPIHCAPDSRVASKFRQRRPPPPHQQQPKQPSEH